MDVIATRRERVVLELEDNFSTPMARAAASAALLNQSLERLDGTSVRTRTTVGTLGDDDGPIARMGRNSRDADRSINQLTGRLSLFADLAAIFGPTLAPIGAVAVPAVAGLAAQFGFAALAGGTAIIAFQSVGDALTAVNKAALEPTSDNLQAAREALAQLSPAARDFVTEVQSMRPALESLRDAGAEGLFPGLLEGMDAIESRLPDVERILSSLGDTLGDVLGDAGESLASDRWDEFFTFLGTDARTALSDMAAGIGSVTHGLSELWMAFDPLNDSMGEWLADAAAGFDEWASGLSQTEGFQEFVAYIRENGPIVADAMQSIGNALLQIVEAAAPLGGPVLQALGAIADVVAAIADSDLGTPIFGTIAAMAALSRATAIWGSVSQTSVGKFVAGQVTAQNAAGKTAMTVTGLGKTAATLAGLTLASTELGDSFEFSNTAALGLMGTMGGPVGTAIGLGIGLFLDMKGAADDTAAAVDGAFAAIATGTREQLLATRAQLKAAIADDGLFTNSGALQNALWAVNTALKAGKGPADIMAGAIGKTGAEMEAAARDADLLSTQLSILAGFFDKRAAIRNYEQSLADFRAELRDGALDWRANTKAGRENLGMLDQTATSLLQVADQIENKKKRRSFLQDARADLVALKEQFPASAGAIDKVIKRLEDGLNGFTKPRKTKLDGDGKPLKDKLRSAERDLHQFEGLRPKPKLDADDKPAKDKITSTERLLQILSGKKATPKIAVDPGNSYAVISGVQSALNRLPSQQTIEIQTRHTSIGADGGTVPRTGKPYADRHPYLLADGEEIISNRHGQADRHRSLLKAINAGRLADGGTTGGFAAKMSQFSGDANLSFVARAAAEAAHGLHAVGAQSEKELTARQRLLEKEVEHDKQRLDNLKAERDAIADMVSGAFHVDPFGQTADFSESGMSAAAQAQHAINAQMGALESGIAEKEEAIRLLKILRKRGLNGPAFVNLAATGDVETLRAFVDLSKAELREYERLTNRDARLEQRVGAFAADAEVGKELRAARRDFRESTAELKQVNQRLKRLEEHAEVAPRETGKAVGDELKNVGATGSRRTP